MRPPSGEHTKIDFTKAPTTDPVLQPIPVMDAKILQRELRPLLTR